MKIKSIFAVAIITLITAGGFFAQGSGKSKSLVLYFSWGGTTEKMAKMISSSNGGELFRIEPTNSYPTSYTPCTKVVKDELDKGIFRTVPSFHSARIRLLTARKRFRQLWMQHQLPITKKAMARQTQSRQT